MKRSTRNRFRSIIHNAGLELTDSARYVAYFSDGTAYNGISTNIFNRLCSHDQDLSEARIILSPIEDRNVYEYDERNNTRAVNNPRYRNVRKGFGGLKRPVMITFPDGNRSFLADSLTAAAKLTKVSRATIRRMCDANVSMKHRTNFEFKYADQI